MRAVSFGHFPRVTGRKAKLRDEDEKEQMTSSSRFGQRSMSIVQHFWGSSSGDGKRTVNGLLVRKERGRKDGSRTEYMETIAHDEGEALEIGKVKELELELVRA